jgi:DNA-binding NarL/FixJ family response regulator
MSGLYVLTDARRAAIQQLHQHNRDAQEKAPIEEIIRLMCEGLCDKRISRKLDVSVSLIKAKRCKFMARNNIKGRTQLGAWAVRQGLV